MSRRSVRLLLISGSLRKASTNTRLLQAALQLMPPGVQAQLTTQVGQLPLFNPDLDVTHSEALGRWIEEVRNAAAIVVSTPEYARGYPGALKNALDWLVSTDAFVNKPFMLLNASARSTVAQATLSQVLETMSGVHIKDASITVPLLGTNTAVAEILADPSFARHIREALSVLITEIERRTVQEEFHGASNYRGHGGSGPATAPDTGDRKRS
jgi:chromate reductase, NAD(P)H dehydrogenase (quinone)